MALTNKLTAIADAIREKGNTSALLTLDAMPAAIAAIETGGGGSGEDGVPNPILIKNSEGSGAFRSPAMNWVIDNFGDRIQTTNLMGCADMFYSNTSIEEIPFDFNCSTTNMCGTNSMFYNCNKLKTISGTFNNLRVDTMRYMFIDCQCLRELPTFNNIDLSFSTSSMAFGDMFRNCYSLRHIPESLLKQLGSSYVYNVNGTIYNAFSNNYVLDELVGIPTKSGNITSNVFSSAFSQCNRLKRIVFATNDDGTPATANWSNQTISLNIYVGFDGSSSKNKNILNYNSGITSDKLVNGLETYNALKNDPDWYATTKEYSRYNGVSAVETLASLPDTTAFLASNSGTNTIKFLSDSGFSTDGGSINNAITEEIAAAAAAKGWTITFTAKNT